MLNVHCQQRIMPRAKLSCDICAARGIVVEFARQHNLDRHRETAFVHTGETKGYHEDVVKTKLTACGIEYEREFYLPRTGKNPKKNGLLVDFIIFPSNPRARLYVEIDEYQHGVRGGNGGRYTPTKELARMQRIAAATPDIPVVFLRYNPHAFKTCGVNARVTLEDRLNTLMTCIARFDPSSYEPGLHIEYIFYDVDTSLTPICTRSFPDDVRVSCVYTADSHHVPLSTTASLSDEVSPDDEIEDITTRLANM